MKALESLSWGNKGKKLISNDRSSGNDYRKSIWLYQKIVLTLYIMWKHWLLKYIVIGVDSVNGGNFHQIFTVGHFRIVVDWKWCYSRHSGIIHFSTSRTSAPQMEPSAGGIFTIRSLLFMPRPQVALQTSHSPHSVTRQLLGAKTKRKVHGTESSVLLTVEK